MTGRFPTLQLVGALVLAVGLGACSSHTRTSDPRACEPACEDARPNAVHDPFEPINREIFRFNTGMDVIVINPTLRLYRALTIPPVRASISNFLRNLVEFPNAINILLQNNPRGAVESLERFAINSTLGIAGLFDVAGRMGLQRQNESFLQTLAVWGMRPGPYLVLPFFGPSRMRDATGLSLSLALTSKLSPYYLTGQSDLTIAAAQIGALRERYLDDIEEVYATQVDPYIAVRNFYVRAIALSVSDRGLERDGIADNEFTDEDEYDNISDFDEF